LDRGNIGNSKLLNSETGDSLMQQTNMSNLQYAIAVSLFAVAYAVFEVPSNWIMKRYVRPSRWLATLLFCWGILTIGFAGVKNFTQVTVLRFLIGMLYSKWRAGLRCGVVN
jgi:MFS family permease